MLVAYAPPARLVPLSAVAPRPVVAPPAVGTRVRRPGARWRAKQWLKNLCDGSLLVPMYAAAARRLGLMVAYGELRGRVVHGDGTVTDYGLLGRRVVTAAGVNFLAACFDNTNEPEVFKYHGFGTGTTAESTADTALVTELTTGYASANTRPTGSQAHSTNTYTTVATLAPSADAAVTEHGIFSSASSGSGTLWDRTKFNAINLVAANPDSLQSTYTLTLPSGG